MFIREIKLSMGREYEIIKMCSTKYFIKIENIYSY